MTKSELKRLRRLRELKKAARVSGQANDRDQMNRFLRAPFQRHSDTSREAASRIEGGSHTLRGEVLRLLRREGPLTDEEVQDRLGMPSSTERPRRVELVRLQLVGDSGTTRQTRSGRKATLWEATRTRAHCCPRCSSPNNHVVSGQEKRYRDALFDGLEYKACDACGHTWLIKNGR